MSDYTGPERRSGDPNALKKLAEMVRRAENGRRIRLTRKGKLAAYMVPPEDVERLEWLEEQERQYRESQEDEGLAGPPMSDYDEPAFADPVMPRMPQPEEPAELPPGHIDIHDEDQRRKAIAQFRRGFDKVIGSKEPLSRAETSRRLKEDGFIASAVLSIIGEG
jgi:prevent-host-death family protein